ncbi:MAG: HAMP domain-containing histidine kinase [Bacteroidetes bacterium]|nr:HAMP domain-containing histidine kinase [Bacteroidota bacterium]MBS1740337.1 HAMP domain-containing histidine kinase [Bacteroidota bacterium]MBS1776841.1 HAMP domain-containing histidine kinase [Bacteroidota bacterium]
MKKVFPLIVLLITLSVLGIIFIQMSWIKNAISLRKQQHEQDINTAISRIKEEFYQNYFGFIGQTPLDENTKNFLLQKFTTSFMEKEDVNRVIAQSIKRSGIKDRYEYVIKDIFQNPIFISPGFKNEHINNTIRVQLTPENSAFRETLYLYFDEDNGYLIHQLGWVILGSVVFTIIIISAFALTVRQMFNQKKLSEIKSDFINNMTHELKTPLATISLAVDALTNEKVINNTDKIRYYSAMIKDENKRMNKQVEKILQVARIERQEIKLNLQTLNAHDIIQKVANNLSLQIEERKGSLTLKLAAAKHTIEADDVHFSNIVFNLLDNAIKYSKDEPRIEIETLNKSNMLLINVTDNGIGMNKETQARVFEKFYRAHTGNLHNVKGFGLGLSYVKAMAEAHGGRVHLESAPGKGSTFSIYFPLS